jgi:protein involved in polysaccharide export with SLBB domain
LSRCNYFPVYMVKSLVWLKVFLVVLPAVHLAGCGPSMQMPSLEQMAEFEDAGYNVPSVDLNHIAKAKMGGGPYRVVPGDVLEITMPVILQVVTADEPKVSDGDTSYTCRVSNVGAITLPVIGDIEAAGKTLAEIESAVVEAYYPAYTAARPLVSATINEYNKARVSITGAVENPGVYELRSNEMSLVALLMQAGGIINEGAARIRIIHADQNELDYALWHKAVSFSEAEPATENTARRKAAEMVVPASLYPGSNSADDNELQAAFQQVSPSSTTGRLTIRRDQTILLSEQLDIADETQRWVILDKLAVTSLHISTAEAGRIWTMLSKLALDSRPLLVTSRSSLGSLDTSHGSRDAADIESVVLPVKGLNIPFADVTLQDSDTVIAEPLEPEIFSVTGLVKNPGNFPYPANIRYNLMQALAFAGGLDQVADPRYATIYRLKLDGTIVDTTFQIIKDSKLTKALNTTIKPGDIIDVGHTAHTRRNVLWDRIFRFTFGAFVPLYR